MKKRILYLSAVLAILLGLTMCFNNLSDDKTYKEPEEEVVEPEAGLWASFESKFNRYEKAQKHAGQTNAAKIVTAWEGTMWLNDRTHTQIVVWSNDDIFDVTYEVSDLTSGNNTIGKENVRLRFCSYVLGDIVPGECTSPNPRTDVYIADALSETAQTRVTPADPVKIWVTVDTPKTAAAGKYAGKVKVKSGDVERVLDIGLTVVNRTLPDVAEWDFHLDLWQFPFQLADMCTPKVDFASDEYFALMEPIYKMLADAGQKVITAYVLPYAFYTEETMIEWTKKSNGSWSFDYTKFDRFVIKMMEWGISKQISAFSLAGWRYQVTYYDEESGGKKTIEFRDPSDTSETNLSKDIIGGETYNEIWTAFLDSFRSHLKAKGWFSKTVLYMDERPHTVMNAIIDLVKGHDNDWKLGLSGSSLDAESEAKMYDYSIYLTRTSQKSTVVKTFYTSCGHKHPNNYLTPENSPSEMTWMGWHAAGNGYNGYLRWAADNWRSGDPANGRDTGVTAGDASMFYYKNKTSNDNDAVASIRLEMLREGIQDYEKIRILNNAELNTFAAGFDPASGNDASSCVGKGQGIIAKVSVQ